MVIGPSSRAWDGLFVATGVGLSLLHVVHFSVEDDPVATLIGVLLPLAISVIVNAGGVYDWATGEFAAVVDRMFLWMVLGMVWMVLAGAGVGLYLQAEGGVVPHARYLGLIFATYGCIPGLLTGWYDGRRREQTELIREREEQLTVLARVLRHNLRNEMNVVLGNAEVIARRGTGDVVDRARTIREAGSRLIELVEEERQLVESLATDPDPEPVALDALLEAVVTDLQAEDAQIEVPDGDLPSVRAVPSVDVAFEELLENAIVHDDAPVPRIEIGVCREDGFVTVRIADDGPGIEDQEREIVTGERTIGPLVHGSGLGLRLASLLIEQSDGELSFETPSEGGTVVVIRLPVADDA